MGIEITLPDWFDKVADWLFVGDLRVRRYFPAFIEACRTVCLIRSFQWRNTSKETRLNGRLSRISQSRPSFLIGFSLRALVFVKVLNESIRDLIDRLSARREKPVERKRRCP